MRLGDTVRPVAYDAELVIVPNEERFSGKLSITIDVTEPTALIWLNATKLDLKKVTLQSGAKSYPGRVLATPHDFVGLRFTQTLPAGRAILNIDYEGVLERADTEGLFKVQDGDDAYVFAHFSPAFARRAFPCFDEPTWKTPWKLALDIPAFAMAVSNAPQIGEDPLPNNLKRVRFAATPPLPSHLVALAVGPFETVNAGPLGRKPVALRFLVQKGKGGETRFAQRASPRVLESLEDYFGAPYPFDKIDIVTVPVSSAFASSEGPGLVALRSDLVLARAEQEASDFQRRYVATLAEELTHAWVGGLVSIRWWDDVWINQAVSAWVSERTLQRFDPEWLARLSLDRQRQLAMVQDRLPGSHPLRRIVESPDEIAALDDGIGRGKGAAVFRMLESWIGEDRFRDALRRYLGKDPFGAAGTDDFVNAFVAEAGSDQPALSAALQSFIDRPGVPALDVTLVCPPQGKAPPRLEVTVERYVPGGLTAPAAPPSGPPQAPGWVFPACFQYGEGGDFGEECTVIREAHQAVLLPEGEHCPDWVVANRDGTSYLVPLLRDPLAMRLEHAPLLADEAVAVIGDTRVLLGGNDLRLDHALTMAARFATNRQAPVARAAVGVVEDVSPELLASNDDRDAFARYVRVEFGPRAQILGWMPKPGERAVDLFLRQALLPLVADRGADAALRAQADRLARDGLAGKSALGAMQPVILVDAAHFGTADLFEAMLASAERAKGRDRRDLYRALGAFRNPALLDRALSLALSEHTDARDAFAVYQQAGEDPSSIVQVVHYVADHYDALAKRLPDGAWPWFAGLGQHLCESQSRRDFENFYGDASRRALAGPRAVELSLEAADLCIATHDYQVQGLRSFLGAPAYRSN
jgi:alanyl aminopeptidase